jgi:hypothetical protein
VRFRLSRMSSSSSALNRDLDLALERSISPLNDSPCEIRNPILWKRSRLSCQPMTSECRSTTSSQNSWGPAVIRSFRISNVWKSGRSRPAGPPAIVSSRRPMRVGPADDRPVMNAQSSGLRRSRSTASHCAAISSARSVRPASLRLRDSSRALTSSASVRGMRPTLSRVKSVVASRSLIGNCGLVRCGRRRSGIA